MARLESFSLSARVLKLDLAINIIECSLVPFFKEDYSEVKICYEEMIPQYVKPVSWFQIANNTKSKYV